MSLYKFVDLPVVKDDRGSLAVIEGGINIPFEIKRVYFLYDLDSDSERGGHAHKKLLQLLIPATGSFDVLLDDGVNRTVIRLTEPNKGLLIGNYVWRELRHFSKGAVCLVLASELYSEDDYYREYEKFKLSIPKIK
jgi:hypothetical protein